MTRDEFDRVAAIMAEGLGLVVGEPIRITVSYGAGFVDVVGKYERSVMIGDPVRIVAVTVRKKIGFMTVPWEQIVTIATDLPSAEASQ